MMKIVRDEETSVTQSQPELVANVDGKLVTAEELLEKLEANKNKPSDEEIKEAELAYQDAATEFSTKEYEIGTLEEADDIYRFFDSYINDHVFWTKNGWMGVIKLNDEISEKLLLHEESPMVFKLGYQALEFTMFMLSNPGGVGLKSALAIEKLADLYMYIMEQISEKLDAARLELKEIQFLYDKWISMQQGFYLEREDGVEPPAAVPDEPADIEPGENL